MWSAPVYLNPTYLLRFFFIFHQPGPFSSGLCTITEWNHKTSAQVQNVRSNWSFSTHADSPRLFALLSAILGLVMSTNVIIWVYMQKYTASKIGFMSEYIFKRSVKVCICRTYKSTPAPGLSILFCIPARLNDAKRWILKSTAISLFSGGYCENDKNCYCSIRLFE